MLGSAIAVIADLVSNYKGSMFGAIHSTWDDLGELLAIFLAIMAVGGANALWDDWRTKRRNRS